MKRTKKHHFLPQFYLSGFAIPDKPTHLWKIWKDSDKRHQVNVKDAGEESDYHTKIDCSGNRDSTSVERVLSSQETEQAELLKRIINKSLIDGDRRRLAEFIALMDMRVPASKDSIEALYAGADEASGIILLKDD